MRQGGKQREGKKRKEKKEGGGDENSLKYKREEYFKNDPIEILKKNIVENRTTLKLQSAALISERAALTPTPENEGSWAKIRLGCRYRKVKLYGLWLLPKETQPEHVRKYSESNLTSAK